jgi:hypothetical protein
VGSTGVPAGGGSQSRQRDKANAKFKTARCARRAGETPASTAWIVALQGPIQAP